MAKTFAAFNSLYWDFCFASEPQGVPCLTITVPFNSLYWDFCFASIADVLLKKAWIMTFNSLYWDFCFASELNGKTLQS